MKILDLFFAYKAFQGQKTKCESQRQNKAFVDSSTWRRGEFCMLMSVLAFFSSPPSKSRASGPIFHHCRRFWGFHFIKQFRSMSMRIFVWRTFLFHVCWNSRLHFSRFLFCLFWREREKNERREESFLITMWNRMKFYSNLPDFFIFSRLEEQTNNFCVENVDDAKILRLNLFLCLPRSKKT